MYIYDYNLYMSLPHEMVNVVVVYSIQNTGYLINVCFQHCLSRVDLGLSMAQTVIVVEVEL